MRSVFLFLFLLAGMSMAADSTRVLRISTWPSEAEIYPGDRPDSFVRKADKISPDSLRIPANDSIVRITLFKPGYVDTTIDIRIKAPGKNFIWIELAAENGLDRLEWQERILDRRKRQKEGKILFFGSFVPFAISGTFVGLSLSKFNDADQSRKEIERSVIREGDHYRDLERDFDEAKKRGKNYRTAAAISLGVGVILLAGAAVLYF